MSIELLNRIRELEAVIGDLEARISVLERADAFEQSEPIVRRKPGRPRKEQNGEAQQ